MGLIASSDNHVGMPGRSYPGDRQIHTPFAGGLCAVWADENTRESLFDALRKRRCYGTTGARIIVKFHLGEMPMGSIASAEQGCGLPLSIHVIGTRPLERVEVVRDLAVFRTLRPSGDSPGTWSATVEPDDSRPGMFYVRVFQEDGQRA